MSRSKAAAITLFGVVVAVLLFAIFIMPRFSSAEMKQAKFKHLYEMQHGQTDQSTLDRLTFEAPQVCLLLDEEHDLPYIWTQMTDSGYSSDQAATVIASAVQVFCPEYTALLS